MQKLPSRIGERRVSAAPCCTSSGSKRHSYVLVNKRRGTIIHNSVNIKTLLIQIVEHNSTVCAQNVIVLGAFTIPTDITTTSGFSFNSAATNKVYFFSNSGTSNFGTSDCPQDSPSGSYSLLETWGYANWFKIQRFTNFGGYIYVRFYMTNAWKPWMKFTAS